MNADAGIAATNADAAPPAPHLKLVTIGMHVGGGPYDEPTKEPMKRSVEPRFADLARCWSSRPPPPPQGSDVGVDLVIEAKGGRARVQNPRVSGLAKGPKNENGLEACIVSFFESVDFLPPKNGKTVVSYSIRVTPQKP